MVRAVCRFPTIFSQRSLQSSYVVASSVSGRIRRLVARCSHFERLTEPADVIEADQGASDGEGEVHVGTALVAPGQVPKAVEPGQGAFSIQRCRQGARGSRCNGGRVGV